MKRITVRLKDHQYDLLVALAQELNADVTAAVRALISAHQRTQQLLDALVTTKQEILQAVVASRTATTENLKRVVQYLTNHSMKE